ncbi:hypothetical protein EDD17DRAFT_1899365 [Pisolithus thermaeus]|nr:hypothetical protein EDD17DRAFT_1899365 [Pisolithus thermaeus]
MLAIVWELPVSLALAPGGFLFLEPQVPRGGAASSLPSPTSCDGSYSSSKFRIFPRTFIHPKWWESLTIAGSSQSTPAAWEGHRQLTEFFLKCKKTVKAATPADTQGVTRTPFTLQLTHQPLVATAWTEMPIKSSWATEAGIAAHVSHVSDMSEIMKCCRVATNGQNRYAFARLSSAAPPEV